VLPLFCNRDLEINPMTLKLKGDQDILKMYTHTENEAASPSNVRSVVFELHATAFLLP